MDSGSEAWRHPPVSCGSWLVINSVIICIDSGLGILGSCIIGSSVIMDPVTSWTVILGMVGVIPSRRTNFLPLNIPIFSCVVGAMVGVGVYAVEHGDPARVLAPLDADANFCGIDYPDYPYLYYQ